MLCRSPTKPLAPRLVLLGGAGAVAAFHLAFLVPWLGWLVLAYLGALFALRHVPTPRWAFYTGLGVGLGIFVPHLAFFWGIFGAAAASLWLILALWHALFLLVLHKVQVRWGTSWATALAPVLWLGLEYFRSELYYLRFSWLGAGSVPPIGLTSPWLPWVGVYGLGALFAALAATATAAVERRRVPGIPICLAWVGLLLLAAWPHRSSASRTLPPPAMSSVKVLGLQLEFPGLPELLTGLDAAVARHPEAVLIVLPEYTFEGPVPERVRAWCRRRSRYLVAGGTEPAGGNAFYNTSFVIDSSGNLVFSQVKAVPIQFFKDGLPAPRQGIWHSPWGPIGLCVCYDLNFSRVVDRLARSGARALLVPTMDLESWGRHEHHLNARLAPIRAAEYRIAIARVASSGISQIVEPTGRVVAEAPFPGPGETVAGTLWWEDQPWPVVPLDRWVAPVAVVTTAALGLALILLDWRDRRAATAPTSALGFRLSAFGSPIADH